MKCRCVCSCVWVIDLDCVDEGLDSDFIASSGLEEWKEGEW